jgi:hypothetical protein
MVRTRASEAASSSAARQRRRPTPLQDAQDPESEPEIAMDVDTESDDTVEVGQSLVSRFERAAPPRTGTMTTWYMTTPVFDGIRSGADTLATTMDAGSS